VIHDKVKTMNVVGKIKGSDPVLKEQIIVVGAHYDHLGLGGPGSGSRVPDTSAIHNGADDNASVVAGIIEIAEALASKDASPKRSIVVVAFGAEEMGLIGSKYFVEHPIIDIDKVVAMFNFDMIGRLNEERSVAFGGTGTSKETEDLLNTYLDEHEMKGSFSSEGFGPSDHAAFYAEDIPVFFISTGAHGDYHTPLDDVEFIDFEGQKAVSDLSLDLIMDVANRDEMLTFQEAGAKTRNTRMNFKVTLGIVPDFTSTENNGLGVGGVRDGGPADKGGMKKGDRIVALDGMEVTNIYDYMARLKKLEAGQIITVDVIREGEKVVLLVQL
jgi:Zn-dependent M28 family amino/carboxypeptidase